MKELRSVQVKIKIYYTSPAGESVEVAITGGHRYDECDAGSILSYPMREACSEGNIPDQVR